MSTGERLLRLLDSRDRGFPAAFAELERRYQAQREAVDATVAAILEDVRQRGDAALIAATERFDGYRLEPDRIMLSAVEIEDGARRLSAEDCQSLELAAERVRSFHSQHVPRSWQQQKEGEMLGQRVRPLASVGLYVPAAKAPLASTVLMLALPAAVAGVEQLVITSPGETLHPAVLAAARLAGVTRIARVGGAQAVGALAFGTESIPRVDKIVGPGNAYVQSAKRQVFGEVAIDAEAGPSELLIVADDTAPPALVAADLLAQAEHEEMASVVLITPSESLARSALDELAEQIADLPRESLARKALAARSAAIVTRDLDEAFELANRYAAEHLELLLADPEYWLDRVENAGAIFLGTNSPVPLGDYVAGPSHVLPTGGTARFFSVVGVEDFLKRTSVIQFSEQGMRRIGWQAIRLAELEGLEAHARAVRRRLGKVTARGVDPDP